MDGELPQFGKIRVVQRLVAKGRIPDYGVDAAGTDQAVLEADVEMLLFGIEVSRNGRGRGIKFHGHKMGIEVFRAEADEITDTR